MNITIRLDNNEISKAQSDIDKYKSDLRAKAERFCLELADVGIIAAKSKTRTYGAFIIFSKQLVPFSSGNPTVIFYAKKTTDLIREWYSGGELKRVEIDPLLMEEFGSGFCAFNPLDVPGVGQGSFPGQKHAFDEEGWYWIDANDPMRVVQHSYGETPGQPMYNARELMYQQIQAVAKRVFRNVV